MLKNITLSAEAKLIAAARAQAISQHTTLNEEFRLWLEQYTARQANADRAASLIDELQGSIELGRKFDRDELNER